MTARFTFAIATVFCMSLAYSQSEFYRSEHFTIRPDRVVQGTAEAVAQSRTSMTSTYHSPFRVPTPRVIDFKFSINGFDNEQPVGQNHRYVLPAEGGAVNSPRYVFGSPDAEAAHLPEGSAVLLHDAEFTVSVDMRKIMTDFAEKGFTILFNGERISKSDFKGVFVAGGIAPLSWDFGSLPSHQELELHDPDGDGIFNGVIHFPKESRGSGEEIAPSWKLTRDISMFPTFESTFPLVDCLYNKSLEELQQDIRDDGALMAGAMWPGVWTRDISYSIILAVAAILPDAAMTSLMAKVKDGRIIQDTGTGGSWPISSDRMVWALAAWEVYVVTGDREWLENSYKIIKQSADEDLHAVYDKEARLFRGESSFLDWREQTYPRWMDPKDIYESKNLGTNIVHVMALDVLARMSDILGESAEPYRTIARDVSKSINQKFWMKSQKYYGQYLYGRKFPSLSPRMEALGEALSVLSGVANASRAREIVQNVPLTSFGVTCIYPQIPNIPPYHNDAVWPFVETFWGWASAQAGNMNSVEASLASVWRAAGLFMTDKENFVASTGDYRGTEINSSRQLWSVAGNLATVYRILLGMRFTPDALEFSPCIPKNYDGVKTLRNFHYRNSILTIEVRGHGNAVASVTLDGTSKRSTSIPATLAGNHTLVITMNGKDRRESVHRVTNAFSPEAPSVKSSQGELVWEPVQHAVEYRIVRNGAPWKTTKQTHYPLQSGKSYEEFQVLAVDEHGNESFLSEPRVRVPDSQEQYIDAAARTKAFADSAYVRIDANTPDDVTFLSLVKASGTYALEFLYANGNGPINTDNKCAIRTLTIDNEEAGVVVLPQRGVNRWDDWGYSNAMIVALKKGQHVIGLHYSPKDRNMNGEKNEALVKELKVTRIK